MVKKELVEDRFQAFVLTDSFELRFLPLADVQPRCLLPLANVPLLEYTLEFLAKANVNEVYLMCTSHGEAIKQYVAQLKWADNRVFTVNVILLLESTLIGDAMRDIDNRGIVTGDFLLVQGDVVTNIDFSKVMAKHKQRRAVDKDHILTMVLAQALAHHRSRLEETGVFALDRDDRCIYYDPNTELPIAIDALLLESDIVLRNDLIDCHIDVCTPHVPQIYQDNFDYQYPRLDFLKGVLSLDLVKKTAYAYIADDYAARVDLVATYKSVSEDIMGRYTYPLVPDLNFFNTTYNVEPGHIYKEDQVVLAQSCTIGACTVIGAQTEVGDGSLVRQLVLGRGCRIGHDVTIENLYLFDGVIVEEGVVVRNLIIGAGAVLRANVTDEVIAYDETVEDEQTGPVASLYLHVNMLDELVALVLKRKRKHLRTRRFLLALVAEFSDDDEDFDVEAVATVLRALDNNHDLDTAALELNTLRMLMNVLYHDVRVATVTAYIKKITDFVKTDTLAPAEAAAKIFRQWTPLFKKQVFDAEEEIDLLTILETQLTDVDPAYNHIIFLHAVKWLYELDVCEEENILLWWNHGEPSHVRSGVAKFIEWLEDAEEESDDE